MAGTPSRWPGNLLRDLPRAHPRYGYRRMTTILRRVGFCVNHKPVQRLCGEEGLRVVRSPKKRSRVGVSTIHGVRLHAARPDHVRELDFQFDQTRDLRSLKILNITDEFTKEAFDIDVRRSLTADDTVGIFESLVVRRGRAPEFLRMDNGPKLTANALRDWCRFSGAGPVGLIQPRHSAGAVPSR